MKLSIKLKRAEANWKQCEATFDGMCCEQDLNHHIKHGRALKHNNKGVWWTDQGAEEAMKRQHKQWLKEEGL